MQANDIPFGASVLQRHAPLHRLLTVTVYGELDVIASRLRARQVAALCRFSATEQARVATAVSELARHCVTRTSAGKVQFFLGMSGRRQVLVIVVEDRAFDPAALAVETGSALPGGLSVARRFLDEVEIVASEDGVCIVSTKHLPAHESAVAPEQVIEAVKGLAELPDNVALSEAHQQNRELTLALAALQAKQDELLEVSADLERTNRQVEALNVLLKEKADSLTSADRRKDEFLSILSHELRGPLSAAGMAATLLVNGNGGEQSVKLGQVVSRQVGHMSQLVEDLLDVSRVSRGLVLIRRQPVDLREVVKAAFEQLASAAESKGHAVGLALPAHACIVEGDRTRLLQIVANLLGNAIRYTPDRGRIDIRVERQGEALQIRVSDNGIGIPATLMPHLFDLYTQAEHSTDARNSGLGLGLALVKSLVDAHGGSVSAHSAGAGHGSLFEVRLPLAATCAGPDLTPASCPAPRAV